jgi:hypothetical protein
MIPSGKVGTPQLQTPPNCNSGVPHAEDGPPGIKSGFNTTCTAGVSLL